MSESASTTDNSLPDSSQSADECQTEIRFYRANERPYGALSNLYRCTFTFEDQEYPTAEHAYQAGKARKPEVRDWILSAPTPALVAMAAHGLYTWDIVPNWSKMKFDRMRRVLRAKFTQNENLRFILLSTGTARIIEAATVDNLVNRTWGEVNGKGRNMLGSLLMELRDELRLEMVSSIFPIEERHEDNTNSTNGKNAIHSLVSELIV